LLQTEGKGKERKVRGTRKNKKAGSKKGREKEEERKQN
jgi:hypothetical protein